MNDQVKQSDIELPLDTIHALGRNTPRPKIGAIYEPRQGSFLIAQAVEVCSVSDLHVVFRQHDPFGERIVPMVLSRHHFHSEYQLLKDGAA